MLSMQSPSLPTAAGLSNLMYSTAAGKLPFSPPVLSGALKFLRLCLEFSAAVSKEQKQASRTLPAIASYFKTVHVSADGTYTGKHLLVLRHYYHD